MKALLPCLSLGPKTLQWDRCGGGCDSEIHDPELTLQEKFLTKKCTKCKQKHLKIGKANMGVKEREYFCIPVQCVCVLS
jgi:hypothetical protein